MSESPPPTDRFVRRTPEGDNRPRLVCADCGYVRYDNPKVVVGVVASWDGKILLCRRSIEPRRGFWTLPAGFLEMEESAEEGAVREAREEANASLELEGILAVYSVPRISQIQIFYRARLRSPEVIAGEETEEAALFAWEDIPWSAIAFSTVRWALEHYRQTQDAAVFPARVNPVSAR